MQIKVDMNWKKETKGTHVYEAVAEDAAITTLYIAKRALPRPQVGKITVTVESRE